MIWLQETMCRLRVRDSCQARANNMMILLDGRRSIHIAIGVLTVVAVDIMTVSLFCADADFVTLAPLVHVSHSAFFVRIRVFSSSTERRKSSCLGPARLRDSPSSVIALLSVLHLKHASQTRQR